MFQQVTWPSSSSLSETPGSQLQQNSLASTVPEHSQRPMEGGFPNEVFQCEHQHCQKIFLKKYKLTKHERTHSKPVTCELCPQGVAQPKDLHRHYWTKHRAYAEQNNIPKDQKTCEECGYTSRSDNVKRHQRDQQHIA